MSTLKTSKIPAGLDHAQSILFYASKLVVLKAEQRNVQCHCMGGTASAHRLAVRVSATRRSIRYHAEQLDPKMVATCTATGGINDRK